MFPGVCLLQCWHHNIWRDLQGFLPLYLCTGIDQIVHGGNNGLNDAKICKWTIYTHWKIHTFSTDYILTTYVLTWFTLCCILTRNVNQVCLSVSPIQLAYIVELLDTNCKDHLHWGVSNCCDVSIVEAHDFLSPCMCPSLVNACIAIITALTDSGQSWSLLLYRWFLCHDNNQHNVLVAQPHLMMLKHLPSSTK